MTAGLDLVSLISTLGFPIAVTVYLLWRDKPKDDNNMKEIAKVVTNNTEMLGKISEVIKECKKNA